MKSILAGPVALLAFAPLARADLKSDGAFGFPQTSARVLCDSADLRLSVACDGSRLFVQAVMWTDGDDTPGLTGDGRKIGDHSTLDIDVDANGGKTANVDRAYTLNPWPTLPGLHYSISYGESASSGLQAGSEGRGSIQYVDENGKKTRVDTYLIPLDEISRKEDDPIQFAFLASSTEPRLTVNSIGFEPRDKTKPYYTYHLPAGEYHRFKLEKTQSQPFDASLVPEGRGETARAEHKSPPKIGRRVGAPGGPVEINARNWMNWSGKEAPTLAGLKGKVVVVEFWATWCAPCVAGIPHLNELHQRHEKDGLVILSLTDQDHEAVEKFVKAKGDGMTYPVGMGSTSGGEYGVAGIPHACVISREGKLLWQGHPADPAFEESLASALKAN
jgi:thiol-disulfide isomerase/thioredoxin